MKTRPIPPRTDAELSAAWDTARATIGGATWDAAWSAAWAAACVSGGIEQEEADNA